MIFNRENFTAIPLIIIVLIALIGCSQTVDNPSSAVPLSEGEKLHAIIDSDWERYLKQEPEMASFLGDVRYNQKWSDTSLNALIEANQQDKTVLNKLSTIKYEQLIDSDKINYDLFKWQIQTSINNFKHSNYLMPINQLEGVQLIYQFADYFP